MGGEISGLGGYLWGKVIVCQPSEAERQASAIHSAIHD